VGAAAKIFVLIETDERSKGNKSEIHNDNDNPSVSKKEQKAKYVR
jgi:hypothetical protein